MASIFINYRRSDSSGWTRGLHERLADAFEAHSIFYDVDDIAIGEDFISSVVSSLSNCRVVLMIIGPNWLNVTNPDGTRRLDHPDDHVRREIELAMQRNVKIIPVLVGGAVMPTSRQLPPSIAAVSTRHAHIISDSRFSDDMEKLVRVIQKICGIAQTATTKKKGFSGFSFILGGVIAAVVVIIGFIFLIAFIASVSTETDVANNNGGNVLPTATKQGPDPTKAVSRTTDGTRIEFDPGKSSKTVAGAVLRGERDTYILGAGGGQTMRVRITSLEDNAVFQVMDDKGNYHPDAGEEDDATNWSDILPGDGDYKVIVSGTRGNASYKLTVSIQ